MIAFARLLDALGYAPARSAKQALLRDYFRTTPDPDRGWALAALTGGLKLGQVKAGSVRVLIEGRMDPELFRLSYDFVGDLAETVALVWPGGTAAPPPSLDGVMVRLTQAGRAEGVALLAGWLDGLDATGRWALLKLVTGGLRVGVSARLALVTLAESFGRPVTAVEELWHALPPPYGPLFAALMQPDQPLPEAGAQPVYRPVMLSHPLDPNDLPGLDPADFRAEWKWDGVRVQAVGVAGQHRLYTRTGEDLGAGFPDLLATMDFDGVLDGELLVGGGGQVQGFNAVQQRLNRKSATPALLRDRPAFIRLYDVLFWQGRDWRDRPFDERRAQLEQIAASLPPERFDLSPLVPFADWQALAALRAAPPDPAIEGVMLKRADSAYLAGRPKGPWFKWKRDPLLADCVLMYAQRGHGRRSSYYSDFTVGCWQDGALVPVGKAYFGFTDAELLDLDRWVRGHTTNRFGPVREVAVGLVLEIAFDGVARSPRHKSGIALRFPRIHRIRWDKPAAEADSVTLFDRWLGMD